MKHRLLDLALSLLLLVAACGTILGLGGCSSADVELVVLDERTVSVHAAEEELPDVVVDACEILGMTCEAAEKGHPEGRITVFLFDLGPGHSGVKGRSVAKGKVCTPVVWADVGPEEGDGRITPPEDLLAHELGHALGLSHRSAEERANLMSEAHEAAGLDDEQLATMREEAARLKRCP